MYQYIKLLERTRIINWHALFSFFNLCNLVWKHEDETT